jgi:hypothetical protein
MKKPQFGGQREMNRTKIDNTNADDEQLRQWQDTLCGEIVQDLARVIYRRALLMAGAKLEKLTERTNEAMKETATKLRAEAELADQYR